MGKLLKEDILTEEVFGWTGLHLLNAHPSSCSQKLRIYLNLKKLPYQSRMIDIPAGENYGAWYMGINPRGLVPTLVHDGAVIIESNDIIEYLEAAFPETPLVPAGLGPDVHAALAEEDDLHLDVRALSNRYLFPPEAGTKTAEAKAAYAANGSGTVGGAADRHKAVEQAYFDKVEESGGITETHAVEAAGRLRAAFDKLETALQDNAYLLGDALSVLDIAWYVYAARLVQCGYPLQRVHPAVGRWFDALNDREDFRREVQLPPPLAALAAHRQDAWSAAQQGLPDLIH